jgi:hypothetical protein
MDKGFTSRTAFAKNLQHLHPLKNHVGPGQEEEAAGGSNRDPGPPQARWGGNIPYLQDPGLKNQLRINIDAFARAKHQRAGVLHF